MIDVIVGGAGGIPVMLKLCVTCGAGLVLLLPGWLPTIVQVPNARPVTVLPDTVQTAVERLVNVTGNPDDAVALTVPVPPTLTDGVAPRVIAWLARVLLKLAVTLLAAVIVSVQMVAVPVHAPPQPVKLLPVAGVAVSVTAVPLARLVEHLPELVPAVPVQLRPLPAMEPEPVPAALTVSAKVPKDCPLRTRRTKRSV